MEAAHPVEMDHRVASRILHSLSGESSFLGVELGGGVVLQFMYEQGAIWTELLYPEERRFEGCTITPPMADIVLSAAYQGIDIKTAMAEAGYSWLIWETSSLDD